MSKDKMSKEAQMSAQAMKAAARESAKNAPKANPKIAVKALADAEVLRKKRLPAQKLSATPLKDAAGDNRHHPKDQILSEFDGPTDM